MISLQATDGSYQIGDVFHIGLLPLENSYAEVIGKSSQALMTDLNLGEIVDEIFQTHPKFPVITLVQT